MKHVHVFTPMYPLITVSDIGPRACWPSSCGASSTHRRLFGNHEGRLHVGPPAIAIDGRFSQDLVRAMCGWGVTRVRCGRTEQRSECSNLATGVVAAELISIRVCSRCICGVKKALDCTESESPCSRVTGRPFFYNRGSVPKSRDAEYGTDPPGEVLCLGTWELGPAPTCSAHHTSTSHI